MGTQLPTQMKGTTDNFPTAIKPSGSNGHCLLRAYSSFAGSLYLKHINVTLKKILW